MIDVLAFKYLVTSPKHMEHMQNCVGSMPEQYLYTEDNEHAQQLSSEAGYCHLNGICVPAARTANWSIGRSTSMSALASSKVA